MQTTTPSASRLTEALSLQEDSFELLRTFWKRDWKDYKNQDNVYLKDTLWAWHRVWASELTELVICIKPTDSGPIHISLCNGEEPIKAPTPH